MFLRSLGYSVVHSENGNTLCGCRIDLATTKCYILKFFYAIGMPGAIDIVVLSSEIFSTCFFLQCRNIGPKLIFCIFFRFLSHKLSPPILNNFNNDILLVIFGKKMVLAFQNGLGCFHSSIISEVMIFL